MGNVCKISSLQGKWHVGQAKAHGIMEMSPICNLSAFSLMADTSGWSAETRQKRRAVTSWMPFSERLRRTEARAH